MPRNHMIVGLDDSPSGRAALRWAAQHALLAGSVLRAIHVLDWPYSSATPGVDITPATMDEIESAYRTNITNVFQEIGRRPIGRWNFLEASLDPSWCESRRMRNYWSSELGSMSGSVDCWSVRSATIA